MMAAHGVDILTLTNAALQSLNGPGMDFTPSGASSFSHGIFSPLQPTTTTGSNGTTKSPPTKGSKFTVAEKEEDGHIPRGSPPVTSLSSLSPLTISARDIDGGSKDFTEYCNDTSKFMDEDSITTASHPTTTKAMDGVGGVLEHSGVDFFTPPRGTSSPSAPVRVRVSASKLRQIPSPLSCVNKSTSSISDSSLLQGQSDTSKVKRPTAGTTKAEPIPQVWTTKSLKQGVLLDKQGGERTLNSSDDSVVVSGHPTQSNSEVKRSRTKLLQGVSDGRNPSTGRSQYSSESPQRVKLVHLSSSGDRLQPTKMAEGSEERHTKKATPKEQSQLEAAGPRPPKPHPPDVMETAQLVARCTAAATAALLASNGADWKPADNKATTFPLPPPCPKLRQSTAERSQHGLPAGTLRPKQPVTKRLAHANKMDKYGKSVESISAHCGDRETNTGRLSQKQRKQGMEKEENKTKPIVELSSSQEETTPLGSPCPDWNKPTQQSSYDQTDARGKGGGRLTCLHHRNTQTTGDLARNRNRERDSSHSAPTLNSETVAATLINAKNDITSRRTRAGPSSLTHAAGAKSPAQAHAQLMDIIDRVKKLEDLQHVRNIELQSKGSWHHGHPTSSRSNGAHIEDGATCYTSLPPGRAHIGTRHYRTRHWTRLPYNDENGVSYDKLNTRLPVASTALDGGDNKETPLSGEADLAVLCKQASPSQVDSRHTSLHSKPTNATQSLDSDGERTHTVKPTEAGQEFDDVLKMRTSQSLSSGGQAVEKVADGEVMDVLVNAQKVLFEVQSSKRHMEMQSDLDETERAFGDLVKALQDAPNDRCQEGIPWKVAEFLSSLPFGENEVKGKDGTSKDKGDNTTTHKSKQRSESSRKKVKFDTKPPPSHHTPSLGPCQHVNPAPTATIYDSGSGVCHHACPRHGLVSHRPLGYSTSLQQQAPPTVAPYHHTVTLPHSGTTVQDLQPPPQSTSTLPTAVPLGAPCIMPSPHYDELDSMPGHPLPPSTAEPWQGGDAVEVKREAGEPVESTLVEGGSEESTVSGRSQTPLRPLQTEGHLVKDDAGERERNGSAQSEASDRKRYSAVGSMDASAMEMEEEMAVSIAGQRPPTPPPRSPPVFPSHTVCGRESYGTAQEGVTSEELDKRLQDHLRSQASEWIGRELMARMLSGLGSLVDPVPPHCHYDSAAPTHRPARCEPEEGNSMSTNTVVDDSAVAEVVKDVVKESIANLVNEMTTKQQSPLQEKDESVDDYSYTTPESGSMTSSDETTPLLSTPQATPPASPSPSQPHSPTAEEVSLQAELATPTATPPLSICEVVKENPIATPEATEEDLSTATEHEQSDLCTKSLSSSLHPDVEVSTPASTSLSEPISLEYPQSLDSAQTQVVMADKSQQVTPIHESPQPLSESVTTTSSSQVDTSTTSESTTFREISEGEFIRRRPGVPFVPNTSLSEGEVPLSPGDARWYSMYAAKMTKAGLAGWKASKSKRKFNPTMETFLDLKSSQDPSSASDTSQQSEDTQKVYSIGEVRMSKRRLHSDPFEKFVSRLNAISPDSSSTPVGHTVDDSNDNTLSDMPSIHHDKMSTPVAGRKHDSNLRQKIRVIPYHKRYPLVRSEPGMATTAKLLATGGTSPGEVPRHILNLSHGRGGMKVRHKAGSTHSIGELHVYVGEKLKAGRTKGQVMDYISAGADSPKSNSQRDGIDVIDISRHSAHLSTTKEQLDEVSSLDSVSMDDVIVVQPSSTATQQVIQVRSYESSETSRNTETAARPAPNQPSLSITTSKGTESKATQALDTLTSKPLTEVFPQSKEPPAQAVGTVTKPLTVVIPTAEVDTRALSSDSQSSVSENIDASYTSDFDFSSVSIPGL